MYLFMHAFFVGPAMDLFILPNMDSFMHACIDSCIHSFIILLGLVMYSFMYCCYYLSVFYKDIYLSCCWCIFHCSVDSAFIQVNDHTIYPCWFWYLFIWSGWVLLCHCFVFDEVVVSLFHVRPLVFCLFEWVCMFPLLLLFLVVCVLLGVIGLLSLF